MFMPTQCMLKGIRSFTVLMHIRYLIRETIQLQVPLVGVKAQGEQALARASGQIFEVLNGKGPKVSDPYKDEFGTWRTGVAAVYDHKGEIMELLVLMLLWSS